MPPPPPLELVITVLAYLPHSPAQAVQEPIVTTKVQCCLGINVYIGCSLLLVISVHLSTGYLI